MSTDVDDLFTLSGDTMGTRWSVVLAQKPVLAEQLFELLQRAVSRVDMQMSPWIDGSFINRFECAKVDDFVPFERETGEVLNVALRVNLATNGAFNPAVMPAVQAAGYSAKGNDAPAIIIPAFNDLFELQEGAVKKTCDGKIDLCGIAKGYGVDQLADILTNCGFTDFVASIDGEIVCRGCPPNCEGWQIAIEAPSLDQRKTARTILCTDMALASSGGYRSCILGPQNQTHTINPNSGSPVSEINLTVCVAAETCAEADAWATALTVLGDVKGSEVASAMNKHAYFVKEGNSSREFTKVGLFQ